MKELSHVLFDFFGTLVAYSESRLDQGFHESHEILAGAGSGLEYRSFLERWDDTFQEFETRAQESLDEYSMDSICDEFLKREVPLSRDAALSAKFRDTYLREWNKGVAYLPGVTSLLGNLSERFTLVLLTNTHHADLVHCHLAAMGAARYFTQVVTSVEHGRRKPSRCIFEHALHISGGSAEKSVYVGDSYSADYLGAVGAGIRCLLIDPKHRYDVPPADRLIDVFQFRRVLRV